MNEQKSVKTEGGGGIVDGEKRFHQSTNDFSIREKR